MSKRLLAIEDDTLHHMIIGKIAMTEGYETTVATSVGQADYLLRSGPFDCVTLDLSLGEHAGVEVLHILASIGASMPVVIFSGADDATCIETIAIGEGLGLNIYPPLIKPRGVVELRKVLASIGAA